MIFSCNDEVKQLSKNYSSGTLLGQRPINDSFYLMTSLGQFCSELLVLALHYDVLEAILTVKPVLETPGGGKRDGEEDEGGVRRVG